MLTDITLERIASSKVIFFNLQNISNPANKIECTNLAHVHLRNIDTFKTAECAWLSQNKLAWNLKASHSS